MGRGRKAPDPRSNYVLGLRPHGIRLHALEVPPTAPTVGLEERELPLCLRLFSLQTQTVLWWFGFPVRR